MYQSNRKTLALCLVKELIESNKTLLNKSLSVFKGEFKYLYASEQFQNIVENEQEYYDKLDNLKDVVVNLRNYINYDTDDEPTDLISINCNTKSVAYKMGFMFENMDKINVEKLIAEFSEITYFFYLDNLSKRGEQTESIFANYKTFKKDIMPNDVEIILEHPLKTVLGPIINMLNKPGRVTRTHLLTIAVAPKMWFTDNFFKLYPIRSNIIKSGLGNIKEYDNCIQVNLFDVNTERYDTMEILNLMQQFWEKSGLIEVERELIKGSLFDFYNLKSYPISEVKHLLI